MAVALRSDYLKNRSVRKAADEWLANLSGLRGRVRHFDDLRHPGLVVLDLMPLFCEETSPAFIPAYPHIEENIFRLIELVIKNKGPVVFTRHVHPDNDSGGLIARFFGRLQRKDDPLTELVEVAQKHIPPAIAIEKNQHSAFSGDNFAESLSDCDSLIIAGVTTNLCVVSTAIDCSHHNLVPIVPVDATTAINEQLHLAALSTLASGHAHVSSVMIIAQELFSESE
jgi:nicotinamidase-related amidase